MLSGKSENLVVLDLDTPLACLLTFRVQLSYTPNIHLKDLESLFLVELRIVKRQVKA